LVFSNFTLAEVADNTSISKAVFVGHVPELINVDGFVNKKFRDYRFTVKEKTRLEIKVNDNTKRLYVAIVSMNDELLLDEKYLDAGFKFGSTLFLPGDYCLKVKTMKEGEASVFSAIIKVL
jgi:hypothetical protein